MTGFCWAYCNALLEKLIALDDDDKIFKNGGNKALHVEANLKSPSTVTDFALSVMSAICGQIPNIAPAGYSMAPSDIGTLIENCREFLDIFKQKETPQEVQKKPEDPPIFQPMSYSGR